MSYQAASNQSSATSVDRRLKNIETVLDSRQIVEVTNLAFSVSTATHSSRVMGSGEATPPSISRPSMYLFDDLPEGSGSHDADTDTTTATDLALQPAPSSSFELSASFLPETYTVLQPVPTLFCYNSHEEQVSDYNRVIHCAMFYSRTPRKWTRLTFDITTSIESGYWNLTRTRPTNLARQRYWIIPTRIHTALESFVRSCERINQDSHLSIYLGSQLDHMPIKLDVRAPFQVNAYLRQITSIIDHWDCPRYYERQLIQRPLLRYRPGKYFAAFLQSRWTMENRFGSNKRDIDSSFYILVLLHCLNGKPGVNPLVGVVLDDDSGIANAFLYGLPSKGDILQIIDLATKSGQQISWQRREKWCRQIVQGVAEIHSQGFVLGCLGENLDHGVYVDADDNAVHANQFRKMFTYDRTLMSVLPPEYHRSPLVAGSRSRQLAALPKTDLYQLGLFLWRIASHKPYKLGSQFCAMAGCTTKPDLICAEPHAYAVQLPSPGEHVPQYLRDVIAACRTEDPDERPPAWKLLDMFPPASAENKMEQTKKCVAELDHDLETRCEVICDKCHRLIPQRFFQCNFCNSNDFDLCPDCLDQGAHCFQANHYLREQWVGGTKKTSSTEEIYYSNPKENGQRDIVTL